MSQYKRTALVLGAGGIIGSHMVKRLRSEGYWVRGVDLKYPEYAKYKNTGVPFYHTETFKKFENYEDINLNKNYYPILVNYTGHFIFLLSSYIIRT